MCTRNQAEEILHSVYHACSPIFGRIHDAYLYGSYARGDFNPESDIDILLTVDLEQAEIAKHRNDVAKVTSRLSLEHDITVSVTVKPLEGPTSAVTSPCFAVKETSRRTVSPEL